MLAKHAIETLGTGLLQPWRNMYGAVLIRSGRESRRGKGILRHAATVNNSLTLAPYFNTRE